MSCRPLLATATAAIALGASLAGCGGEAERSDASSPARTSAAASSPAAPAAPGTAAGADAADGTTRSKRKVREIGRLTYTPLADYTGRVSISESDRLLAVAVGGPDGLQLRVSRPSEVPQPAPGAGRLPVWARIHVGSDRNWEPVVTYPRCRTTTLSSCDIYEWSTVTRRERLLTAASAPGRADLEAATDQGDVIRVTSRSPSTVFGRDGILEQALPTGTVTLKKRGERSYRLAASGGYGVTLAYGKIGLLVFTPSEPCGAVTAKLVNSHTRRTMFQHRTFCDQEEGGEPVGVGIGGGQFMFGFTRTYEDASVYAHPVNTGPKRQRVRSLGRGAMDYEPVNSDGGFVVEGFGCDGRYEGPAPRGRCHVDRVTGLALG